MVVSISVSAKDGIDWLSDPSVLRMIFTFMW
jgi:hypothetical protein